MTGQSPSRFGSLSVVTSSSVDTHCFRVTASVWEVAVVPESAGGAPPTASRREGLSSKLQRVVNCACHHETGELSARDSPR